MHRKTDIHVYILSRSSFTQCILIYPRHFYTYEDVQSHTQKFLHTHVHTHFYKQQKSTNNCINKKGHYIHFLRRIFVKLLNTLYNQAQTLTHLYLHTYKEQKSCKQLDKLKTEKQKITICIKINQIDLYLDYLLFENFCISKIFQILLNFVYRSKYLFIKR